MTRPRGNLFRSQESYSYSSSFFVSKRVTPTYTDSVGQGKYPDNSFDTGVREQHIPVGRALALQSSSRNCYPAPDLVLWKLFFPRVFFSGGLFLVGVITYPEAAAKEAAEPESLGDQILRARTQARFDTNY